MALKWNEPSRLRRRAQKPVLLRGNRKALLRKPLDVSRSITLTRITSSVVPLVHHAASSLSSGKHSPSAIRLAATYNGFLSEGFHEPRTINLR